jgi:hypothetical protein
MMDEHTADRAAKQVAIEEPDLPVDDDDELTIRKVVLTDDVGTVIGSTEMFRFPDAPTIVYVTVTEIDQPSVTVEVEVDWREGRRAGHRVHHVCGT